MHEQVRSPARMILDFALGYQLSRAIYLVARLGIADLIAQRTMTVEELAVETGTEPEALYRVLRCVSGTGVLHEEPARRFALTPAGEPLRGDAAESVRAYILFVHEQIFTSWAEIGEAVRTGEPRFEKIMGASRFEYLRSNPDAAAMFHDAMLDLERLETPHIVPPLIETIDAAKARKVIDVGGGHGALLSALLAERRELASVLMDLAPGIEAAKAGAGGPLPGCEFVIGDALDRVPVGGDVYILQQVLHIFHDDDCVAILRNCREAMTERGRVCVIERMIGPPNENSPANLQDLAMLVVSGGVERTPAQYARLLESAGLFPHRNISTPSVYEILEAVKTQ